MVSRRARRNERLSRKKSKPVHEPQKQAIAAPESAGLFTTLFRDNYKKLLIIPFILLILALLQLGFQYASTGDFLNKGVSLEGGLTLTIPITTSIDTVALQELLAGEHPNTEILVRSISEFGEQRGITIEAATKSEVQEELKALELGIIRSISRTYGDIDEYSVEVVGPSLGASFFRQTLKAVVIAFLLMGIVVFFYFGENTKAKIAATVLSIICSILVFQTESTLMSIIATMMILFVFGIYVKYSPPSSAVILAAFSDIVMTLAVVNLLGIKLSTAGIAAFLMLIGYSVDTDILLSTRVLKHGIGTSYERVLSSMKTGMTMTMSSLVAAFIALIFTQSETIRQIMLIILIGLIADIINTWLQNAGIVRMYADRRNR